MQPDSAMSDQEAVCATDMRVLLLWDMVCLPPEILALSELPRMRGDLCFANKPCSDGPAPKRGLAEFAYDLERIVVVQRLERCVDCANARRSPNFLPSTARAELCNKDLSTPSMFQ